MNPEPCGHQIRVFFYPDDVTRSSSVPCREISSQDGYRSAVGLFPLFPLGVLFTRMNPDAFRILVDGQIRFEYATCGWNFFLIQKEKVADSKMIRIRVDGA